MRNMTFDLDTECDPLYRAGVHGLRLACDYVRKSDLYPGVPGEDELTWEIQGSRITLNYENESTLSRFMDSILGEFPRGYAVPPGYTADEDDVAIYQTAKAHMALMRHFTTQSQKEEPSRRAFKLTREAALCFASAYPDKSLTSAVGSLLRSSYKEDEESDKVIQVFVTPCLRWFFKESKDEEKGNKKIASKGAKVFPVTIQTGKKGATKTVSIIEMPRVPLSLESSPADLHLSMGRWNNGPAEIEDPNRIFLLAFAGLAYVHAQLKVGDSTYGWLSLGLDAESFEEFDVYFKRYAQTSQKGSCFLDTLNVQPKVGALVLASALGLPSRSYHVIYSLDGKKGGIETPSTMMFEYAGRRVGLGKVFVAAGMEWADTRKLIRTLKWAPLSMRGSRVLSVYDVMEENLSLGLPWYRGSGDMVGREIRLKQFKKKDPPDVRVLVTKISRLMGDSAMEDQIRWKMQWLTDLIVKKFYNKAAIPNWDRARQLAEGFVVKRHLKPITTRGLLLQGIRSIVEESGGPGFTMPEMKFLESMPPTLARDTLIIGSQLTNVVAADPSTLKKGSQQSVEAPNLPETETEGSVSARGV